MNASVTVLTFERKGKMCDLPDFAIVIVKDLVLDVVLSHVSLDEDIIDNSGSDRLLLDLQLRLEVILNV